MSKKPWYLCIFCKFAIEEKISLLIKNGLNKSNSSYSLYLRTSLQNQI